MSGMYLQAEVVDTQIKTKGSIGVWHKRTTEVFDSFWQLNTFPTMTNHIKTVILLMHLEAAVNWRLNPKPVKRNGGIFHVILNIGFSIYEICIFCFSFQYELSFIL